MILKPSVQRIGRRKRISDFVNFIDLRTRQKKASGIVNLEIIWQ